MPMGQDERNVAIGGDKGHGGSDAMDLTIDGMLVGGRRRVVTMMMVVSNGTSKEV